MGRQYPNGYLADDNVMYPSYGAAVAAQQKREAARQQARRQAVTDMQPFANALRGLGRAIFPGAGGAVAAQTGGRPEGTLARLGGREVQWTKDDNGRWGWLPFQTEGQMARQGAAAAQTGGRPEGTLARLGGREVQWTKDNNGRWGWLPFQTEGQMARQGAAAAARIPVGRADPFAPPAAAAQSRNLGTYSVAGVGTFDAASGRMLQAARRSGGAAASAASAATSASATATPAAPGLGGYTPMVTPATRARQEAANQALQNAGGANISQPILAGVPDDAVKASKEYAQARAAIPMAELPAVLDQRSQEYSQRADIQAWLRNMQNGSAYQRAIADRFLTKQRPAAPLIGQRSEAPDYSEGGAPTQPWTAADAPGPAPERGTVIGEKYYGKTWDGTQWIGDAQAPMAAGALGTQAAYGMAADGIEFVPQATAQASNLNFNSPLPQANASQAFGDEAKKLAEELAGRYQLDIKNLAFGAV